MKSTIIKYYELEVLNELCFDDGTALSRQF